MGNFRIFFLVRSLPLATSNSEVSLTNNDTYHVDKNAKQNKTLTLLLARKELSAI